MLRRIQYLDGRVARRSINGLLPPPLILLVILITSDTKVMGKHVNPPLLRYLGWATFVLMVAAAIGMVVIS